jgi:arylsulfatase A
MKNRPTKFKKPLQLLAALIVGFFVLTATPGFATPPNFIVIMADDLGYETIGANGGKSYCTPHLDRLAREGVRFEHCYAQPNCTPSRVQIMTGMSNVRNYVSFGELEKSQTTFGHLLHDAGYATCIAGKWQLGSRDRELPKHFGFDEHVLWTLLGRGERYADPSLSVNGELKTFEGKFGPDICQEYVLNFIRRNKGRPFFVYYPMIFTHGPFEATPDSADWGQPTAKSRQFRQEHFADMVAYMDKQAGELDRELTKLGLRENTLLLFTADNGTAPGITSELDGEGELAGEKGNTTRTGMRVPLIASWPGKIAAGKAVRDLVDLTDFLPTLCDAAGVAIPPKLTIDGRSFLPQLRGESRNPRQWIYSYWVPLREKQTTHVGARGAVEQAFDHRYKLYSTGTFFDLQNDPEEASPLRVADLKHDAAEASKKLQAALDQFRDARPAHLPVPVAPGEKKKRKQ